MGQTLWRIFMSLTQVVYMMSFVHVFTLLTWSSLAALIWYVRAVNLTLLWYLQCMSVVQWQTHGLHPRSREMHLQLVRVIVQLLLAQTFTFLGVVESQVMTLKRATTMTYTFLTQVSLLCLCKKWWFPTGNWKDSGKNVGKGGEGPHTCDWEECINSRVLWVHNAFS